MKVKKNSTGRARRKKFDRQAILARAKSGRSELFISSFFLVLITAMLAWPATDAAKRVSRQLRSVDFTEARAEVLRSELIVSGKKKKRSEFARIEIKYWIGIEAEMRHGVLTSDMIGGGTPTEIVQALPPAAPLVVYYNEESPDEFVVFRGLRGVDVLHMMIFSFFGSVIAVAALGLLIGLRRVAKYRKRLRRLSRNRKTIHWIKAFVRAGLTYAAIVMPVSLLIVNVAQRNEMTASWAIGLWIAISLPAVAVFIWQCVPRYLSGRTSKRMRRRINSSSDREAPNSA